MFMQYTGANREKIYQSLQRRESNRGSANSNENLRKPASRMRLRNIIAYYGGDGSVPENKS
jgi:hypothetical protein